MKTKTLQILNIIGFVLMIAVNALANALPIAGKNTGEVSALYPSLFTPAGFTFSIWGVIYLLLLVFVVYQAKGLFGKSNEKTPFVVSQINIWFLISCLANAGWIFVWHHQKIFLSTLIMLVILFSLIRIYINLGIGKKIVEKSERYLVQMPFSVYLAWISVATIANVTILLVAIDWNGFGLSPEFWTSFMITIATALTIIILFRNKDMFYSLVILWAYYGISSARMAESTEPAMAIIISLGVGMVLVFGVMVYTMVRRVTR
jgi:hypothetical protein